MNLNQFMAICLGVVVFSSLTGILLLPWSTSLKASWTIICVNFVLLAAAVLGFFLLLGGLLVKFWWLASLG